MAKTAAETQTERKVAPAASCHLKCAQQREFGFLEVAAAELWQQAL